MMEIRRKARVLVIEQIFRRGQSSALSLVIVYIGSAKSIYNEPEKYFTDDILKQIDEAAQKEYSYGNEI